MSINFMIRSANSLKATDKVTINVQVRKGNLNYRSTTGLKIPFGWWDTKKKTLKAVCLNENEAQTYNEVSAKMTELQSAFQNQIISVSGEHTNSECDAILTSIIFAQPEPEAKPENPIPSGISEFCQYYIAQLREDSNKSPNTVKAWNSFQKLLDRFLTAYGDENHVELTFDRINLATTQAFRKHCTDVEGYALRVRNKYTKTFRALVHAALKYGVHNNTSALSMFENESIIQRDDDGNLQMIDSARVVLTPEEVEALVAMPLEGLQKQVRDMFCIGIATVQRVSDYSRLSKSQIIRKCNGYLVKLTQQKTGNNVTAPVLFEWFGGIVESYQEELPNVCEQVIGRYIKDILKELSKTVPSLATEYRTILRKFEREGEANSNLAFNHEGDDKDCNIVIRPKYELVSTHTARRTGATILHNEGLMNDHKIMSIGGWKTESSFYNYIIADDTTAEDDAEDILNEYQSRKK